GIFRQSKPMSFVATKSAATGLVPAMSTPHGLASASMGPLPSPAMMPSIMVRYRRGLAKNARFKSKTIRHVVSLPHQLPERTTLPVSPKIFEPTRLTVGVHHGPDLNVEINFDWTLLRTR